MPITIYDICDCPQYNAQLNEQIVIPNIIYEVRSDGRPPHRAYWIGRKLKNALYGCVCSCSVLKVKEWAGPHGNSVWELTPELAAVKIVDLEVLRQKLEDEAEDPVKEVAAMQFCCRGGAEPNILSCWDVFQDERYIYMCMLLCTKGELYGFVERNGRFEERVARYWFKQLLSVSARLHVENFAFFCKSLATNIHMTSNVDIIVYFLKGIGGSSKTRNYAS